MRRFLITGVNGFIGRAVSSALVARGKIVTGLARHSGGAVDGVRERVLEGEDFTGLDTLSNPLGPCDCVIHLAARVHLMRDIAADPVAAYRATNVDGTLRVARAARQAGAHRFVFVSSVKAAAEVDNGTPLREFDAAMPSDPYGASKLQAERALTTFGRTTGMEIVIVRPPLVYGPGVRANFLRLMAAIARGIPLPLSLIGARRSMVFVDNLADALICCALHPYAAGETFYVSDGFDLTVAELARTLSRHLNVSARLIPVPVPMLRLAGRLIGCSTTVGRLVNDLRLDTSHIGEVLGWRAPYSVEEGLLKTVMWYRSTH